MKYDVIIIGAGHNGLVSSIYLAQKRLKVLVIEARNRPGGMSDTEEYKGVKYSRASYVLGLFPKRIQEELGVVFPTVDSDVADVFVTEDGKVVNIWRNKEKRLEEFKRLGQTKYPKMEELLFKIKEKIEKEMQYVTKPPSFEDFVKAVEGTELEIFTQPSRKFLNEYLDKEFQPYFSYGFMYDLPAYVLAYYFSLDWKIVRGGMGKIGEILMNRAKQLGVDFIFNTKVNEIIIKDNAATGVRTNADKIIESKIVINAVSPVLLNKLTNGLLKVYHPEFRPGWKRDTLILRELPNLPDYVRNHPDTLFTLPIGEVTIPSTVDNSLGGHVMTIMGSYEEAKEFFPDLEKKVVHVDRLDAYKLEREYNAPFGDMNHMPMYTEYLFDGRPVKGWGYTTPVKNLYVTGSGTYPGGQVTGVPGRNAAMKIITDLGI
ncbi:phytoene desaturase family protein [Saccharolobus islandicus]|uniref:FAD dependent oxidoreductase n=2 Tax=Saccharolobus islandicus TaxID=43080 RepID=C3MUK7_SACI4|nr:NAD(P)-binding protein [Sulfolobus islandicus]ACP37241.1 FAD dependent oxidoreductase [Sulfolobus islandicus M.14.25]ACP54386.1 FAD dependent oxidoreductase [Sulfolobus islandicus M.16.27]